MKPCDARLMRCFPISTRINHVANDDEECSAPVELAFRIGSFRSQDRAVSFGNYALAGLAKG